MAAKTGHREVFVIPDEVAEDIDKIWGGKLRSNELETVLDLYFWAKKMGILHTQRNTIPAMINLGLMNKPGLRTVELGNNRMEYIWKCPVEA